MLLGDDDQPVLMDLGSVNQARIEVRSSREAMAVQVPEGGSWQPGGGHRGRSRAGRCRGARPHPHRPAQPVLCPQDWAAQHCTISYRAPELFTVDSQCVIDERTDVWVRGPPPAGGRVEGAGAEAGADRAALQSLGCVLYCMMFGEGPYDMVFQKGDSVALAVQNPVAVPPHAR